MSRFFLFTLLFSITLLCVTAPKASALLPDRIQKQIDSTNAKLLKLTSEVDNFVLFAGTEAGEGFTRKTAERQLGNLKKIKKITRKIVKKLRKQISRKISEGDSIDSDAIIAELQNTIDSFRNENSNFQGLKEDIIGYRDELPFANNATNEAISKAESTIDVFNDIESGVLKIIRGEVDCKLIDLKGLIEDEISEVNKAQKLIRARLRKLFTNLKATQEIKALQNPLKKITTIRRLYKRALRKIEAFDDSICNVSEITLSAGQNILCTYNGSRQPSGFGSATFTCTYPTGVNNAILKLKVYNPLNFETTDFGFSSINLLNLGGSLRISTCPSSLPICEKAAEVFSILRNGGEARLEVIVEGNQISELIFTDTLDY